MSEFSEGNQCLDEAEVVRLEAGARALIKKHADSLTRGAYLCAARNSIFPSTLRIGTHELVMSSAEETASYIEQYVSNLKVECYARTEVEITHLSVTSHTDAYALTIWRHISDRGGVIDEVESALFLHLGDDDTWRFGLGEVPRELRTRYADGLPFAAVSR